MAKAKRTVEEALTLGHSLVRIEGERQLALGKPATTEEAIKRASAMVRALNRRRALYLSAVRNAPATFVV